MSSISAMYLEVPRLKSLPSSRLTCQGFLQILIPYWQAADISSMTVPIHHDHNVPTITEALVNPSLNNRRID
jgi:hypothetical protein